jgi:hypothetical protein
MLEPLKHLSRVCDHTKSDKHEQNKSLSTKKGQKTKKTGALKNRSRHSWDLPRGAGRLGFLLGNELVQAAVLRGGGD